MSLCFLFKLKVMYFLKFTPNFIECTNSSSITVHKQIIYYNLEDARSNFVLFFTNHIAEIEKNENKILVHATINYEQQKKLILFYFTFTNRKHGEIMSLSDTCTILV